MRTKLAALAALNIGADVPARCAGLAGYIPEGQVRDIADVPYHVIGPLRDFE